MEGHHLEHHPLPAAAAPAIPVSAEGPAAAMKVPVVASVAILPAVPEGIHPEQEQIHPAGWQDCPISFQEAEDCLQSLP